MILEAVRDFILSCPYLALPDPVHVDFHTHTGGQYSVNTAGGVSVVKQYKGGDSRRIFDFALSARLESDDDRARLANAGFFEDLQRWLEVQTQAGLFPTLAPHQTPLKLEAYSQYLYEADHAGQTAVYQIQCRLTYFQRGT